jgi:hypothetical protein
MSPDPNLVALNMMSELGASGMAIGLELSDYSYGAANVIREYGTSSDELLLAALTRYHAWRTAASQVAADYDVSDADFSMKRSQMFDHVKSQLAISQADVDNLGYVMRLTPVDYVNDPYKPDDPLLSE